MSNYARMLVTPSLLFESESYEPHVIVRAKDQALKSRALLLLVCVSFTIIG